MQLYKKLLYLQKKQSHTDMNTTLVKTHSAADGATILKNTEAHSTALRPIVCYAMEDDVIVISGCDVNEAADIIKGTDAAIFETR